MDFTGSRKKQFQVFVDFRNGANGRSTVTKPGELLKAERGLQAFDQIDLRSRDAAKETARFKRQAFEVLALSLRIKGSEG